MSGSAQKLQPDGRRTRRSRLQNGALSVAGRRTRRFGPQWRQEARRTRRLGPQWGQGADPKDPSFCGFVRRLRLPNMKNRLFLRVGPPIAVTAQEKRGRWEKLRKQRRRSELQGSETSLGFLLLATATGGPTHSKGRFFLFGNRNRRTNS